MPQLPSEVRRCGDFDVTLDGSLSAKPKSNFLTSSVDNLCK